MPSLHPLRRATSGDSITWSPIRTTSSGSRASSSASARSVPAKVIRSGTLTSNCRLHTQFGLTRYPPSFLLFILTLQSSSSASGSHGPHLNKTSLLRSFDKYWRWCIRDDRDRRFVVQKTDEVRAGASWTTNEYRQWIKARAASTSGSAEPTATASPEEDDSDEAELIVTPVGDGAASTTSTEQKEPVGEQHAQDVRVAPDTEGPAAPAVSLAVNGKTGSVEEKKDKDDDGEENKVEEEKDLEEQNATEKVVEQNDVEEMSSGGRESRRRTKSRTT